MTEEIPRDSLDWLQGYDACLDDFATLLRYRLPALFAEVLATLRADAEELKAQRRRSRLRAQLRASSARPKIGKTSGPEAETSRQGPSDRDKGFPSVNSNRRGGSMASTTRKKNPAATATANRGKAAIVRSGKSPLSVLTPAMIAVMPKTALIQRIRNNTQELTPLLNRLKALDAIDQEIYDLGIEGATAQLNWMISLQGDQLDRVGGRPAARVAAKGKTAPTGAVAARGRPRGTAAGKTGKATGTGRVSNDPARPATLAPTRARRAATAKKAAATPTTRRTRGPNRARVAANAGGAGETQQPAAAATGTGG